MRIFLLTLFVVSWPVSVVSAIRKVEPEWLLTLLWASPLVTGWFVCAYDRFKGGE